MTGLRWQAAPRPEILWRDVQLARERGWTVDKSHYIRGLTSIAAPICDGGRTVRYSITGTAFAGQHDDAEIKTISAHMAELAAAAQERRTRLLEA